MRRWFGELKVNQPINFKRFWFLYTKQFDLYKILHFSELDDFDRLRESDRFIYKPEKHTKLFWRSKTLGGLQMEWDITWRDFFNWKQSSKSLGLNGLFRFRTVWRFAFANIWMKRILWLLITFFISYAYENTNSHFNPFEIEFSLPNEHSCQRNNASSTKCTLTRYDSSCEQCNFRI